MVHAGPDSDHESQHWHGQYPNPIWNISLFPSEGNRAASFVTKSKLSSVIIVATCIFSSLEFENLWKFRTRIPYSNQQSCSFHQPSFPVIIAFCLCAAGGYKELLTKSSLVYESRPDAGDGGRGCGVSANEYSYAHHMTWSPNGDLPAYLKPMVCSDECWGCGGECRVLPPLSAAGLLQCLHITSALATPCWGWLVPQPGGGPEPAALRHVRNPRRVYWWGGDAAPGRWPPVLSAARVSPAGRPCASWAQVMNITKKPFLEM